MADTYTLTILVQGEDQASGPIGQIEGKFSALGAGAVALGNVMASAFTAATGAVTDFVGGAISAAGNFEQSMGVLQAASGATTAQMDQMRNLAVALGNDMELPGASASDAATAMLELSKAGLSVDQTMAAAKGTLQLAAAAETDAATAAQITAGALNAFGLSGDHAAQIADQLAAGANASAASITDLSQGFQQAGFVFNATGQNTDDLVTALSMLTNVGLTGADSGTALKNAMMQLMAPTSQASAVMQQYGINVRDAQGNMLPFRDIIGVLQDKLGGLSPAAREAALKTMLMGDGMKAMLPLMDAGVAGFDEMRNKVNEQGAAQKMAAAQMQGFNGAMGGLSNAVETLQLVIGSALLPVLTNLVGIASTAVGGITTFAQALLGSADAFGQLGPMAQAAVQGLQSIGSFFMDIANQAMAWGQNIMDMFGAGIMDAAGAVINAVMSIGGIIANLLMPGSPPKILPNLDQWGTDAANVYMDGWGKADFSVFNSISDSIKGALDGIAKASGDKGMNVAGIVLGSQDEIAQGINEIRTMGAVSEETFNAIISAAGPAGPQISGIVRAYFDLEAATQAVNQAQQELNDVTAQYAATLDPLNNQLKGIQAQKQTLQDQQRLAKLYEEAGKAAEGSTEKQIKMLEIQELQTRMQIRTTEAERDTAVGAVKAKLDAAKQQQTAAQAQVDQQKALLDINNKQNSLIAEQTRALQGAAGAMTGAAGTMSAATAPLQQLNDTMTQAKGIADSVKTGVDGVQTAMATVAPVVTAVAGGFQTLGAAATPLGQFLSNIATQFQAIATAAQSGDWSALGQAFVNLQTTIMSVIGTLISDVIRVIGEAVPGIITAVQPWAMAFLDWVITAGPQLIMAFGQNVLAPVLSAIGEAIPGIVSAVAGWAVALVAWVGEALPKLAEAGTQIMSSMWEWIASVTPGIASQVAAWAVAFIQWLPEAISQLLGGLAGLAGALITWIVEQGPSIIGTLLQWGIAFGGWVVTTAIPTLLGALATLIGNLFNWIVQNGPSIVTKLAEWGKAFGQWVTTTAIPTLTGALASLGAKLLGWITDQAKAVMSKAAEIGKQIVSGIISGVTGMAGALADKLKSMAKGALDAAKSALGIKSPSQVFMKQVGVPVVDGIVAGISQASPKATTAILELAGKLVDVVSKGVDAFGKLRTLGEIPNSAIASFSSSLNVALRSFADMAATWDKASISWASQFQAKAAQVVDTLAKGVDFLVKLRELGPVAPDAAQRLADGIDQAMRAIVAISTKQTLIALAGAQGFAKAAGEILGILKTGVDALNALQDLTDPPQGSIQRFAQFAGWLVLRFAQVAETIRGPALGAASLFGEAAGKVLGILKSGVDGLTALNDLADPIPGIFQRFASQLGYLVLRMAQVADTFKGDALTSATAFAEAAGKVLGIIKTGVEGLAALANVQLVPQEAFGTFAYGIDQVVVALLQVADDISQSGVSAAAAFAESAGKVLGIVKTGVDALTALAEVPLVSSDAFGTFAYGIDLAIVAIWQVADDVSQGAVEAAGKFAESAGKVLGIIKTGVDGLAALATLQPASASGIDAFVVNVNQLITRIAAAATQFSTDALTAASKFAEAAGKSVGILKTGVDGFYMVDTFAGVSEAAIGRFAEGVKVAVQAMITLAAQFSVDALAAAKNFADVAQQSVDFLKKGVDGFDRLAEMKARPGAGLDAFAVGIQQLVATMIRLSQAISTDALTEAQRLAVSLDNILTVVTGSIKAFKDLADQVGTGDLGTVTNGLAPAAHNLIVGMRAIVIEDAGDLGASVLPSFLSGIQGTMTIALAAFLTLGQNISIGIANGILSGRNAIVNAMVMAVQAAIAAAQNVLGIASPSKVFEQQVGAQMSAGMASGVLGGLPDVQRAVGQVSAGSVAGARGGGSTTTNTTGPIAITVNAAPGQSTQAIAQEVLRLLNQRTSFRGVA